MFVFCFFLSMELVSTVRHINVTKEIWLVALAVCYKPNQKKKHRSLNSTPLLIFHIKTSQTLKLQVVLAKQRIQQYMAVEIQKLLFFLTCYHAQPAMLNIRFLTIHHLLRLRIRVTSPNKFQDQTIFPISVRYCRFPNRNMFRYFRDQMFNGGF